MSKELDELKAVVIYIADNTNGMTLPADRRSRLCFGCLDIAIEHQAGISVLAEQPLWAPVYALIRPTFDALIRGMWLGACATEAQLELFEKNLLSKGKQQVSFTNMIDQVEAKIAKPESVLTQLRNSSWSILSDFTHTGFKHVWRRNGDTHTGPNYPPEETEQVLRLAAALGLFAATTMGDISGNKDAAKALLSRALAFAATNPDPPLMSGSFTEG